MSDKNDSPGKHRHVKQVQAEEGNVPGAALIAALWSKMGQNNETPTELASHLGITYTYLMALARGGRPIPQVTRPVLVKAASYLNIPVAQAYLLADALLPEDFVFLPTLDEKIRRIYDAMINDPLWMGYALSPKQWAGLDLSAKLLICLLYERASRTQFFSETEVPSDQE